MKLTMAEERMVGDVPLMRCGNRLEDWRQPRCGCATCPRSATASAAGTRASQWELVNYRRFVRERAAARDSKFYASECEISTHAGAIELWYVQGHDQFMYPTKIIAESQARKAYPGDDPNSRVLSRRYWPE